MATPEEIEKAKLGDEATPQDDKQIDEETTKPKTLPITAPEKADVDYSYRNLERQTYYFREDLAKPTFQLETHFGKETLRQNYSQWLLLYERYLDINDKYIQSLAPEESNEYTSTEHQTRNEFLDSFKSEIETILQKEVVRRGPLSHVSTVKTRASSILSKHLDEVQKRAELEVKLQTFEEEQRLKEEEYRIRARREALELRKKLEVQKARTDLFSNPQIDPISHSTVQFKSNFDDTVEYDPRRQPARNTNSADTLPYHGAVSKRRGDTTRTLHRSSSRESQRLDTSIDDTMTSFAKLLKRPAVEITSFSGDPTQYRRFMLQFTSKVAAICDNDEERMTYLEQYTKNEAHTVVTGFCHLSPEIGYKAALKELHDRYGDEQTIASAYIQKALAWPYIKIEDVSSLDKYAMYLTECMYAANDMVSLGVLEYHENMKAIVRKLPYQFHEKWRSIVQQKKDEGTCVRFKDLVAFLSREAKKGRDTIFGRVAMKVESDNKKSFKPNTKATKSFATTVPESQSSDQKAFVPKSCSFCNDPSHHVDTCKAFNDTKYDDRVKFVKANKLCFGCLKKNHLKKDCTKKLTCKTCGGEHPTSLHLKRAPKSVGSSQQNSTVVSSSVCSFMGAGTSHCTMAIVPVHVSLKGRATGVNTYAFLDPGSSVTFCTEGLLKQIGGQGKSKTLTIDTMGNPYTMQTKLVKGIQVCDLTGNNPIPLTDVYTKDKMPVDHSHIPTEDDLKKWPHLKDIPLPKLPCDVGLMIGNNVPDVYAPIEVRTGPKGTPHATRTAIGWIPWSVVRVNSGNTTHTVNRAEVIAIEDRRELDALDRLVRSAINLDFPERTIDDKKEHSQEDLAFLKKTNESIQHVDGHYQIDLPFRDEEVVLPNNKSVANQRLNSLRKRLDADSDYKREYVKFIDTLLEKKYAEKLLPSELNRSDNKVWYIPHHGVRHPTKKKLRVVFDCAATYQGISLNQKLLPGPNMTNSLLGVMMRFREEPIGIMGDIESMFYQVQVPAKDRDYLRFLWWPGGDTSQSPEVYRMCVHLFGATSSPACASSALRKTADDNRHNFQPSVVDSVNNSFYVDDYLKSLSTEDEAIAHLQDVTTLCNKGGFKVTKWISNSRAVNSTIPDTERAGAIKHVDMKADVLPAERALGVIWNTESDEFCFKVNVAEKPPTRRNLLSITSSIFDPLGFVAPCILPAKAILQDLCKLGLTWDEPLPEKHFQLWRSWLSNLPSLQAFTVPRCFKENNSSILDTQLHHFADASDKGYGTVSYIRHVFEGGAVSVSLVFAKSRVASLKKVTIPRMELTAATLAVRMNKLIQDEMQLAVNSVYFWTDSMSVIRYIANDHSRFHTFVANRLNTIREATSVQQWQYVPTSLNPADLVSRGVSPSVLKDSNWLEGPEFLSQSEKNWPSTELDKNLEADDPEVKHSSCATISSECLFANISDYRRLVAVMGWIIVYKRRLKHWVTRRKVLTQVLEATLDKDKVAQEVDERIKLEKLAMKSGEVTCLSVEDFTDAEEDLLQKEQQKHYHEEIRRIDEGKPLKVSSPLKKLDPIIIGGLVRVGGRLRRAHISTDAKHPIIVPKSSRLAEMIVRDVHKRIGHFSVNAVIAHIRQRFWIPSITRITKRVISRCVTCRKYKAKLVQQKMSDLPEYRVQPECPPFSKSGVDYFGPFEIKRGRSVVKRYGVLFTCLVVRAVHLEMADSMDTDSCINAIRRFIARRGPVHYLRSDNGSNLVSANRELKAEIARFDTAKIQGYCANRGIQWHFSPPSGSHHGGVWERLIRSVRRILYGLCKEQNIRLNNDGLMTLFCEIESILNNRPLTKSPNSPDDLEPLTPNHLLLFRSGESCPPGLFGAKDSYVKRRWRQIQYLANVFWKRWSTEYLTSLQERQKWLSPSRNICVGDIVLVIDNLPRNAWALGKIQSVLVDKRNLVRIVKVKTKSGVVERPVDKLCLVLEADEK